MIAVMKWLWLLSWDGYDCCYDWYHGIAMVAAMVDIMGLLWLLPWLVSWDCYGCYYNWYHEIAMVAAMIATM